MQQLMASRFAHNARAARKACALLIMRRTRHSFLPIVVVVCAVLIVDLHARAEVGTPLLDPDRGVVLPSALAEGIFKQRRANVVLQVDEWEIKPDDLSRIDAALAPLLKRERVGDGSPTTPNYYRQYLPGRSHQSRVIFVNGFDQTESEMFPDRGIPADRWRHSLVIAYGGGCGFWYGIYLVDEGRFLVLDRAHHRRIICNSPK